MKKTSKKYICILLSIAMIFSVSFTIGASAKSLQTNSIVAEKRALRDFCLENNIKERVLSMDAEKRNNQKYEIYSKFFSGEMDVDLALAELEKLGIYALESSVEEYKKTKKEEQVRSSPTALSYNNVIILYEPSDDTWELGAGVWWSDNSWVNDVTPPYFPSVGQNYNVGGLNGVGISLYDLSGSFSGCALLDTWLYVSAGNGNLTKTTHSPTGNIDSRYGVFHQFQDYAQVTNYNALTNMVTYRYHGKHISVFAKYNGNFVNFNGRARLQYAHTWDQTSISSVGVNLQAGTNTVGVGFNIAFSNQGRQFTTLSPGETLF